ncbi:MaoC family dehydratase [Calderihabitans maritimus]|uniref:Acyl dehydratase MaoC n=1 Tax=Calderihabitans maritimus TaxID=1246530 RepID=A0A1Z5HTW1_9FIRM|nr:MaoC family dehydratase [Calderihabitans maritimus]GAW92962.1 acyl dehydratase MaoC [Calderihabitans maritimus]
MGRFEEIKVGDSATFTKTVSETDIVLFAGITGDLNPVHIDEGFASKTIFQKRIAHGMLSAGFISTVLGTKLPGPGTIYLSQTLSFRAPVFIGDSITARVEVIEKLPEKQRLRLKTECFNQEGKLITTGEALVMFKE